MKRALAALLVLGGCGYHLAGSRIGLPADVRSLSVARIENRSTEYGLEKLLAFALEREILARGQLRWEPEANGADAVLVGTIRSVTYRPVAFNSRDESVQYEVVVLLDLALQRTSGGAPLWEVKGFRVEGEYASSPGVVVVSSARFQQQPLDAANLRDPQWSPRAAQDPNAVNPQLAESFKREALRALAEQAARDLYAQMVEEF
jgi:hypothetical protein